MNTAQANKAVLKAPKFTLHLLLAEQMQSLAHDEQQWHAANQTYTKLEDSDEVAEFLGDKLFLNLAVEGLLEYQQALKTFQQKLNQKDKEVLIKDFRTMVNSLQKCAGHLYDQFHQAPYTEPMQALYKLQNQLGEMIQRGAYERAEQTTPKQLENVANLKTIFKQQPPMELHEYPAMKAKQALDAAISNPNATPEQIQQAVKQFQQEVSK